MLWKTLSVEDLKRGGQWGVFEVGVMPMLTGTRLWSVEKELLCY